MSSEIQERIEGLQKRHAKIMNGKASLAGQLQARKDEFAALVQEIREAGWDPKTIAQDRDRVKAELDEAIVKLDSELAAVETALASFSAAR
jgi:hypothetical protein